MRSRARERQYYFDPTSGDLTVEYYEERGGHGAGCQCDECMADDPAFAEEAHYRTYTPSVPEDAPEEER